MITKDQQLGKIKGMKKVVILIRLSAEYRVKFYELLSSKLREHGIELLVVYGQHNKYEKAEAVPGLDCGRIIENRYLYIGKQFIVWQPAFRYLRNADLIITSHATRNLINYPLILFRFMLGHKLAFWGHGRNLQASNRNSISERLKRLTALYADYWFAYNDMSAEIVRNLGFPEKKIMSVNNAIDTNEYIRLSNQITDREIEEVKEKYSIKEGDSVGIFCSRLYNMKRLDFFIESVRKVKEIVTDFHIIVIGDGPDRPVIEEFSQENKHWFHYVGPRYGEEKVLYFSLAEFQLMPGLVGLHIVDSFALLTPIVTTDISIHSPEIIYLENGINGVMTENSLEAYVSEIVGLCKDKAYRDRLVDGCRKAREKYTIENMVNRFAEGIIIALSGEN
jgi:glycosyltransferase involved in cell wall biosynthesis